MKSNRKNRYGYFVFDDFPVGDLGGAVTDSTTKQQSSQNVVMFDRIEPSGYTEWATFEEGEFDFVKPLYTGASGEKIPSTTVNVLDDTHEPTVSFRVEPDEAYSGSGFSLRSYNEDYTVTIKVVDSDGTRTQTFDKTDDEFYPFAYSGLIYVDFDVTTKEENHFTNVIAYSFGAIRKLQDDDFVNEPEITNHFDVRSEDLEYDTLDLNIRGNKTNYNPNPGARITYSKTGQEFFISSYKYNNNGTVDITAYDNVFRLEDDFWGIMSLQDSAWSVNEWLPLLLSAERDDISVVINSTLLSSQKWSGYISPSTFREAALNMLQGNALAVQRRSGNFRIICPYIRKSSAVDLTFTSADIIDVPEIETDDEWYKIHFTKHKLKLNKRERVEAYHGELEYSPADPPQLLEFSSPFKVSTLQYDFIMQEGTDDTDEKVVTWEQLDNAQDIIDDHLIYDGELTSFIIGADSNVKLKKNGGVTPAGDGYSYDATGSTPVGIIIDGYQYEDSESIVGCTRHNVPAIFHNNVLDMDSCTTMVYDDNVDYKAEFRKHLRYVYGLNKKVKFDSIRNAYAGDYVRIVWDNEDLYGWISQKKDNLNGVYEYEVVCG